MPPWPRSAARGSGPRPRRGIECRVVAHRASHWGGRTTR
uniref:Uncharacterized protein n=1 Tax=Arundo donax TaxID=35708 RepID=A0A0A9HGP3_ARUDO